VLAPASVPGCAGEPAAACAVTAVALRTLACADVAAEPARPSTPVGAVVAALDPVAEASLAFPADASMEASAVADADG
jgi:hypothetical protein